jgi:hypothetical protein
MSKLNHHFLIAVSTWMTLTSGTFADEVIKVFPGGGAEEVLNNPQSPAHDSTGAIRLNMECTGMDQKTFKKGQPGYEDCLKQRLNRSNKARPNGNLGAHPMGQ